MTPDVEGYQHDQDNEDNHVKGVENWAERGKIATNDGTYIGEEKAPWE